MSSTLLVIVAPRGYRKVTLCSLTPNNGGSVLGLNNTPGGPGPIPSSGPTIIGVLTPPNPEDLQVTGTSPNTSIHT
jgi:hypothetical protein